jgi:hypothetical protein
MATKKKLAAIKDLPVGENLMKAALDAVRPDIFYNNFHAVNRKTGNPVFLREGHWIEVAEDGDIDLGINTMKLDTIYPVPCIQNIQESFVKHDQGKPRMDLIFWPAIEDLAKVLTHGTKEYDDNNWHKCTSVMRYFAAAMRHLVKWWAGQDNDKDSGLPHLSHAMCDIMFVIGIFYLHGSSADDRIMKKGKEKEGNV